MNYSRFIKNIRYLIWKIKKYPIKGHINKLEKTQWLSAEELNRLQFKKLKKLISYSYDNVPYYRNLFNNVIHPDEIRDFKDLRRIPILTKNKINNNKKQLISKEYTKKDLIKNSTGGSSGHNLNFYNDRKRVAFKEAVILRNTRWAGIDIGNKVAHLWGSSFDIKLNNKFSTKLFNKILYRSILLSSFDLSKKSLNEYKKILIHFKPDLIIGYSSPLFIFAKFLKDKGIDDIRPKAIISSAEMLFNYERKFIESTFDCKVFNRYGCREFSTIAQECKYHSGMHINSEHIYIECLNESGDPCKPGEKGELIITDLDNYAFPFIRYRIGDVGVLSNRKCPCGRGLPLLEKIEGRTFGITVGTNGRYLGGTFWTLLLRTAVDGIIKFQVIQEKYGEIILNLKVDSNFKKSSKEKILCKIHENCGKDMKIKINFVYDFSLPKSGKHQFIISKVSPFNRETME